MAHVIASHRRWDKVPLNGKMEISVKEHAARLYLRLALCT